VLFFDGDEAGSARWSALSRSCCRRPAPARGALPAGEDPDSFLLRAGAGRRSWSTKPGRLDRVIERAVARAQHARGEGDAVAGVAP
jgi:DNA primase